MHFLASWINQVAYAGYVDCSTIGSVFDTLSTTPGSRFAVDTPSTLLGQALSSNDRASELYITRGNINLFKTLVSPSLSILLRLMTKALKSLPQVLSYWGPGTTDPLIRIPTHDGLRWWERLSKVASASVTFQYMNDREVRTIFTQVNQRIRSILYVIYE